MAPRAGASKNSHQTFALLASIYRRCHNDILAMVAELSEEQFGWRPSPGPQSIGWNLWHIARWDDYFAEILLENTDSLSGLGPAGQIWKSQEVASRWGLDPSALGLEEGGTSLSESEAAAMSLPSKQQVVEYATDAFKHLDSLLPELDDSLIDKVLPAVPTETYPTSDPYGETTVVFLTHAYEHLGTMEALKGMLGLRGSVTD